MPRLSFILVVVLAVVVSAVWHTWPAAAGGGAFTVDSTADTVDADPGDGECADAEGACTLRAAIMEANSLEGSHTIALPEGTYTLTIEGQEEDAAETGDLDIHADIAIVGAGADSTIIDAAGLDRAFEIHAEAEAEISGVTIQNGDPRENDEDTSPQGGAIYIAWDSSLVLSASIVRDNKAPDGGGIYVRGTLDARDSLFTDNEATDSDGGGIANDGMAVTLERVIVSENTTGSRGGGIFHNFTDLTIVDSTISGNHSLGDDGGIHNNGKMTMIGSTVSDNTADRRIGGISVRSGGDGEADITNSTISGNSAAEEGGGLFLSEGTTTNLINTTIAHNSSPDHGANVYGQATAIVNMTATIIAHPEGGGTNCNQAIDAAEASLDSDFSCQLDEAMDNLSGVDPLLEPLTDNGGSTLTHALAADSPAVDSGSAECPPPDTDQRGVPRPQGDACDIGAFELGAMRIWGDLDCDGNVVIGDALKTARYLLGLSVSQEEGCPEPGDEPLVNATPRTWGDVDCDGSVAIGDALKIARWLLGLSVSQEDGCPEIGAEVDVAQVDA